MTESTDAEHELLCHLYKALDEVPSCGCGWPDDARRLVWDILALMPSYGVEKRQRLADLIGPEASQQIVLCAIQRAGLISHGVSVTSNWLEPLGKWVLWAVEQVGGIDGLHAKLENAGYPHEWDKELGDMQPCTDACWQISDERESAEPAADDQLERYEAAARGLRGNLLAMVDADMPQPSHLKTAITGIVNLAADTWELPSPLREMSRAVVSPGCYEAAFGWVHSQPSCRCPRR